MIDREIMEKAKLWTKEPYDEITRKEIRSLIENGNDKELIDRFYTSLEFGTGGMRGVRGAGENRMNIYTVGKTTQGLANYLLKTDPQSKNKGVCIAYDNRHHSDLFALHSARILCANGIKVYLFESLRTTPELSFTIRYLKAKAGIVLTASHNPASDNGYKVQWEDGSQVVPPTDKEIIDEVNRIKSYEDVKLISEGEAKRTGLLEIIGEEVDNVFIKEAQNALLNPAYVKERGNDLKIVYTPLHGTGEMVITKALEMAGFTDINIVPEQSKVDPDFPTVKKPNPEEEEALKMGIDLMKEINADIFIASDPDADRIGVVVDDKMGSYKLFSGNMTGCILTEHILRNLKEKGIMPPRPYVVKTVVTTELTNEICDAYDVKCYDVLTGIKWIANAIRKHSDEDYVFGFEESYGYLAHDYVRDKDSVTASLLVCEAALMFKELGKTLIDFMNEIYKEYKVYRESQKSIYYKGKEGKDKIKSIMANLREKPIQKIKDIK
jgi:phosphoglucomutase